MDLRLAERRKRVAALARKPFPVAINKATFYPLSGTPIDVPFGSGITVLAGGNGAGKSKALRVLWSCLADRSDYSRFVTPPVWLSRLEVEGSSDDGVWQSSENFESPGRTGQPPSSVFFIDAAADTEMLIGIIREDGSPDDLLEGLDPSEFTGDELELISLLIGRRYERADVYEITAFSRDDSAMPYFAVSSSGAEYSLLDMGRGELAAFYLVWRLMTMPPRSIAFIEEPEAHLSVLSQAALIDVLAFFSISKDISMVISSHSPSFLRGLPDFHTVLVKTLPQPQILGGLTIDQVIGHLSIESEVRSVIALTEDRIAAFTLSSIIGQLDGKLRGQTTILGVANGESAVQMILGETRFPLGLGRVVGVLDGDQRTVQHELAERIAFLPGRFAPEEMLIEAAYSWRADTARTWEPGIAGGRVFFELALDKHEGTDHHDWVDEVARELNVSTETFVDTLIELLLESPEARSEAEQILDLLRS